KKADHRLFLATNVDIAAAMALMWNQASSAPDKEFNSDQFNLATAQSFLVYRNNLWEAKIGGGVEGALTERSKISTDSSSGMFPYPLLRGKFIQAQLTLKGDQLD